MGGGLSECVCGVGLHFGSKKTDNFRTFIENFRLFMNRSEALVCVGGSYEGGRGRRYTFYKLDIIYNDLNKINQ